MSSGTVDVVGWHVDLPDYHDRHDAYLHRFLFETLELAFVEWSRRTPPGRRRLRKRIGDIEEEIRERGDHQGGIRPDEKGYSELAVIAQPFSAG